MRLRALAVLLAACAMPDAMAQAPPDSLVAFENTSCNPSASEVMIELPPLEGVGLAMVIYDASGTPIYPAQGGTEIQYHTISGRPNCDWRGDFNGDATHVDWSVSTNPLVIFEFVTLDYGKPGNPGSVAGGQTFRYAYFPSAGAQPGSPFTNDFYRVPGWGTMTPDLGISVLASPPDAQGQSHWRIASFPGGVDGQVVYEDSYEASFPGGTFVMPYDWPTFAPPTTPTLVHHFYTPLPSSGPAPNLLQHPRYTFAAEGSVSLPLNALGQQGAQTTVWNVPNLTLAFRAGRRLTVNGRLDVEGVRLTAATPSAGWHGVHFTTGSAGTWTARGQTDTVVEHVQGVCGPTVCLTSGVDAAVTTTSADVLFSGVTIQDPVSGTVLHGVLAAADPEADVPHQFRADDLLVTGMTGSGVYALGGAEPQLRGIGVALQANQAAAVRATGASTRAFLIALPAFGSLRGPQITGNPGGGLLAASSGRVTFSETGTGTGLGFANIAANQGRGVDASGGALVDMGTLTQNNRNIIAQNQIANLTTGNARSRGAGTVVSARCNWWGVAQPPFRLAAQQGGTLDASWWLTENPYFNPNAPCVNSFIDSGRTAAGAWPEATPEASMTAETPADLLMAVLDAEPMEAVALAAALVDAHPAAPEAASALTVVGALASAADAAPAVVASAEALLAEASATHPLAAYLARAAVRHAHGDATGALVHTTSLVALGGEAARAGHAAAAVVHGDEAARGTAGAEASALAALGVLEATWPGSDEAHAARAHLAARGLAEAPPDDVRTAGVPEAHLSTGGVATGGLSLGVAPNPSAAGAEARVRLVLPEASTVRVAVYDLLGREVAVVLSGALAAGAHEARVSGLAPGGYVVRALGAGHAQMTARLTVVR